MKYDIQTLFQELLVKPYILPNTLETSIQLIVDNGESQKGAMTVLLTGLIYKHYHPEQDVRYHQTGMGGGYSGRRFDTENITPFLRKNSFPCMAESGWLTRSLEQPLPYDKNYPGKISGRGVKDAFLLIYDSTLKINTDDILSCFFQKLVYKRDQSELKLTCPANLTISSTLNLIKEHINHKYPTTGSSRLPNLAIYAAYINALNANKGRYENKKIAPLQAHTASDSSTGAIGDIQINYLDGRPFEGIEIKDRLIEPYMIDILYKKIQEYETVSRYYLLTTYEDELIYNSDEIQKEIANIRSKHGCDVIVNGVFSTLKYFLRLSDTKDFIKLYVELLSEDKVIKYEHKSKWNDLCLNL